MQLVFWPQTYYFVLLYVVPLHKAVTAGAESEEKGETVGGKSNCPCKYLLTLKLECWSDFETTILLVTFYVVVLSENDCISFFNLLGPHQCSV